VGGGNSADPAQPQQASRGPEDGSRPVGDLQLGEVMMLDTWYAPSWGVTPKSLATPAFAAPRLNNPEVARMWSADAVVRALPSVSLAWMSPTCETVIRAEPADPGDDVS
jgi:hypothetical protein